MLYLKITRQDNCLMHTENNAKIMANIGSFLDDIRLRNAQTFIDWLIDEEMEELFSDSTRIIIKKKIVIIGHAYAETDEEFNKTAKSMPKSALIDLLLQWKTTLLNSLGLISVYITYDGKEFTVTPEYGSYFEYLRQFLQKWHYKISIAKIKIIKCIKSFFIPEKIDTSINVFCFHHDFEQNLENNGEILLSEKITCPITTIKCATFERPANNTFVGRISFFPANTSQEKLIETFDTTLQQRPITQVQTKVEMKNVQAQTKEGYIIEYLFDDVGNLISAYPVFVPIDRLTE